MDKKIMDREVTVNNWDEFEGRLSELKAMRGKMIEDCPSSSNFLYRGHRKKEWKLETTLERFLESDKPYSFYGYLRNMAAIRPEIESFTNTKWLLNYVSKYNEIFKIHEEIIIQPEDLKFMIYIRHHGYPSPLLDWTQSPYIAAFFALRESQANDEVASIYVLWEQPIGIKFKSSGESIANIQRIPMSIRSNKRHFLQQCQYTICGGIANGAWHFMSHDPVFKHDNLARDYSDQNALWKINILSSQKCTFLKRLAELNLTSYSLFGTEETLMETLALREFKFRGPLKISSFCQNSAEIEQQSPL